MSEKLREAARAVCDWYESNNDKVSGWSLIKTLREALEEPPDEPHFYIVDGCNCGDCIEMRTARDIGR